MWGEMALAGMYNPYAFGFWNEERKRNFIHPARNLGNAQVQLSDRLYKVKLDVRQFCPDEVMVRTENGELTIEGKHEIKSEGPVFEGTYTARSFTRKFTLPENCKEEELHSEVSTDGLLTITIPLEQKTGVSAIQTHEIKHNIPHPDRSLHPIMKGFHPPWNWRPWHGWPWSWSVNHDDDEDPVVSGFTRTRENYVYRLKVPQFSPDELTVKTQDEFLIIEGAHESKKDGHGYVSRTFQRKYVLPADVTMEDLICEIDKMTGVLTVTVPRWPEKEGGWGQERVHKIVHVAEPS